MWNNIIIAEIVFSGVVAITTMLIPYVAKKRYDKSAV